MKANKIFQRVASTLFGLALLVSGVVAASCSDDDADAGAPYIRVDKATISAKALVNSIDLTSCEIKAIINGSKPIEANITELAAYEIRSNTDWRVVIDGEGSDWLCVYPQEGGSLDGKIRIVAKNNDATTDRATTIYFAFPDGSYSDETISVRQVANTPYLNVLVDGAELKEGIVAARAAETHEVTVATNLDFFYKAEGGDWFRFTEHEGSFTLEIDEYPAESEVLRREGRVVFKGAGEYSDHEVVLGIVQSIEPKITLDGVQNNTLKFAPTNPAAKSFTVVSNYDWTITFDDPAKNDWYTVSPMSGAADEVVTVTVTASGNTGDMRRGAFTITAGTAVEEITVRQDSGSGEAPMEGLAEPVIWGFDAQFIDTYSATFAETGTMTAMQGVGTLSYTKGDGPDPNNKYKLQIGGTGQPYVTGAWPGDYWTFSVPVKNFRAGTKVRFHSFSRCSGTGHKYWLMEYNDGGQWKPVSELKTESVNGESVTYTHEMQSADQTVDVTVEFANAIPAGNVEFRFTCQANWQVNGSGALEARNGGTHRWSGNYFKLEGPDGFPTCPVIRVVEE